MNKLYLHKFCHIGVVFDSLAISFSNCRSASANVQLFSKSAELPPLHCQSPAGQPARAKTGLVSNMAWTVAHLGKRRFSDSRSKSNKSIEGTAVCVCVCIKYPVTLWRERKTSLETEPFSGSVQFWWKLLGWRRLIHAVHVVLPPAVWAELTAPNKTRHPVHGVSLTGKHARL